MLGIALCFLSVNCSGQIYIGYSQRALNFVNYGRTNNPTDDSLYTGYQKEIGVYIWPYQKIIFNISINKPGHKVVITDSERNLLYTQTANSGNYYYTTSMFKKAIAIYDQVNGNCYSHAFVGYWDFLNARVVFGTPTVSDVNIKITVQLLPMDLDTLNKHFVRFLKLGPALIDETRFFSISLSKLPAINIRNEHDFEMPDEEDNTLTDTLTYRKFRNYLDENKQFFQSDTTGLNYNSKKGNYKIIIDFKNTYYLKWDKSNAFFSALISYLKQSDADKKAIKVLVNNTLN